jgi:cytochrome c oxidase subunit II
VLTVTPEKVGEYSIICNEYCGLGHHAMIGRIIVVDSTAQK